MGTSENLLNRLRVMKVILREGPVARSDLPELTGLSAGLISQQTAQLVAQGLVRESRSAGTRGRPRMLLEIAADGGIVVGVSLSGMNTVKCAFVDFAAQRLFECETPLGPKETLAGLAATLARAIQDAIAQSPFDPEQISRVGIAMPALVDSARGEVHFNTTFPVEPTPFAAPISAILGLPVTIENPLDSFARAEHWFGRARHLQNFSLIRVSPSIDCAEFEDGVPKYGPNGLSSSFGHTKVATGAAARPCFCTGFGCLTAHASPYGLLEASDRLADLPFPPIGGFEQRFNSFLDEVEDGKAQPREAVLEAGQQLGLGLANYINCVNPSHVLVTIDNARFAALIEQPFQESLAHNVMPGVLGVTKVEFISPDPDWWWKGTTALALEQIHLQGA